MILGTKSRYAVMAMVELAGRPAETPVRLSELAEAQEITVPYLEQIFSKLKQAKLVKSVRGPGGGYVLAKPAGQTRVGEIVDAVEENIKMTRCEKHVAGGCTSKGTRCLTHDLWDGLESHISSYLHAVSLADIRGSKLPQIPLYASAEDITTRS
ncbi:MAG: Rrf2 family transcriptional regulator [Rickettsiales bacterium]|nr:Rrf2 family transcriptional regulator [Rickettsiales bacterium]